MNRKDEIPRMDIFELWFYVLSCVKEKNPEYYDRFYKDIFPVSFENNEFTITTKEKYLAEWIDALYKIRIEEFLSSKIGHPVQLLIQEQKNASTENKKNIEVPANTAESSEKKSKEIIPSSAGSTYVEEIPEEKSKPLVMEEKEKPLDNTDSFDKTILPQLQKLKPKNPNEVHLPDITEYHQDIIQSDLFHTLVKEDAKHTNQCNQRKYISNPINGDYSFENFVHGNCNDMAYEAAYAVAKSCVNPEMADSTYNPLFIYGPSGLGKTHLLHAIQNYVRKKRPDLSVLLVTSENFTTELIEAIQNGTTKLFRDKYRSLDYLLIDDIQFFGGKKNSSTTEIFNTFNTLFDNKKHIIMTSDRTPSDINELEDRLKTRFSSGLLASISPPDYEICKIILLRRAEKDGIHLPKEVTDYMAGNINTSVRQLEGAYNKLKAYLLYKKVPLTLEVAKKALCDYIPTGEDHTISIPFIIDTVCEYFGVRKDKLLGKGRPKNIVIPRQIAMYLCRNILHETYPAIKDFFNRKDHATVLYACTKVEKDLQKNPETQAAVENIKKLLHTRF